MPSKEAAVQGIVEALRFFVNRKNPGDVLMALDKAQKALRVYGTAQKAEPRYRVEVRPHDTEEDYFTACLLFNDEVIESVVMDYRSHFLAVRSLTETILVVMRGTDRRQAIDACLVALEGEGK